MTRRVLLAILLLLLAIGGGIWWWSAHRQPAIATLARVTADLGRGEALLPKGGISGQAVDQLRADERSAQAKVEAMQAALAQSLAPIARSREIEAQSFAVAASKAALNMADRRLGQRHVTAPAGGRVADVLAALAKPLPLVRRSYRYCRPAISSRVFSFRSRSLLPSISATPWPSPAMAAPPTCPPRSRSSPRRPSTRRH
jgi:multidrug efflux pump subunit AcrA (membrane-fusion protein)